VFRNTREIPAFEEKVTSYEVFLSLNYLLSLSKLAQMVKFLTYS